MHTNNTLKEKYTCILNSLCLCVCVSKSLPTCLRSSILAPTFFSKMKIGSSLLPTPPPSSVKNLSWPLIVFSMKLNFLPSHACMIWPLYPSQNSYFGYAKCQPQWPPFFSSGPLNLPFTLLQGSSKKVSRLGFFFVIQIPLPYVKQPPHVWFICLLVCLLMACLLPLECNPPEGRDLVGHVCLCSPSPFMPSLEGC